MQVPLAKPFSAKIVKALAAVFVGQYSQGTQAQLEEEDGQPPQTNTFVPRQSKGRDGYKLNSTPQSFGLMLAVDDPCFDEIVRLLDKLDKLDELGKLEELEELDEEPQHPQPEMYLTGNVNLLPQKRKHRRKVYRTNNSRQGRRDTSALPGVGHSRTARQ